MPKTNLPHINQPVNYACKPAKVGAVIKGIMESQKITKERVANHMKVCKRTVENWLEQPYLSIPILMQLSELFQENLLLLYRPNIKPTPDASEALRKEIAALRKENTMLEDEKNRALNENLRLRAQNELLMAQVKEFAGKK